MAFEDDVTGPLLRRVSELASRLDAAGRHDRGVDVEVALQGLLELVPHLVVSVGVLAARVELLEQGPAHRPFRTRCR